MSESLYAIFEFTPNGERLRGIFPPTDAGCSRALEYGESEFETFHAADPGSSRNGEAYLSKCHGVYIHRQNHE